ncbi:MAG TPA: class I SAM-dependent methyltransferase [Thermomicrobiales bacterium]|nr:class I SAM-dependent methyltransferase [Thermomicrobiales bacterium]
MGLEAHSRLSSNYRKHTAANPLQRALIDRFHRKIVAEVLALSPQTFLDAGCGEGFVARQVIDAVPGIELTGCDVSDVALEIATDANPEGRFVVGSLTDLPFPDRSFDVVGCFEVLEHLPGDLPRRALSELARVARRAAVLSVPHEPVFCLANAARGKNLDVRPKGSDPDHKQFWSRSAFGALVGEQFVVQKLDGSFPWTICVATVPSR